MARTLPAARRQRQTSTPTTPGPWSMAVMVVVAVGLGAALWLTAGPPSEAWRLPDPATVRATLTASEIADRELITVATAVAWLVLGYLAVTVTLRCAALAADRATRGARWARVALQFTNLITVPAVRRIVDGAVAGTLLVATWMPATARMAVAAEPVVSLPVPAVAQAGGPAPRHAEQEPERAQAVAYTVARGDDLWGIARRMYGDGSRYVDLFEANRDRVMADGERFTDPRVIRIGWVLHLPLPSPRIDVEAGTPTYRVLPGDHLWGIAERLLGDGFRWPELWEANRDREMATGWRFTNPNLIYAGWQLELPGAVLTTVPDTDAQLTPAEPEPTPARGLEPATGALPEVSLPQEAADTEEGSGISWDWPSAPRPLLLTAAGFAVLGTAALFVTRARRAGLLHVPSLIQRDARRTGDAGRVALVSRAVATALTAGGHVDVRLLLVHETERHLTCTIDCPSGDAAALVEAVPDLSERLGCAVEGVLVGAHRVELVLTGAGEPAMRQGSAAATELALMLPVGTDIAGRIAYLNLAGVGSVVVSGIDSERRQMVHAWLATLATTAGADELALRADATAAVLVGDDVCLPHFGGTESPDTVSLVDELEDVIQSRDGTSEHRPLVAVLDVSAEAARHDAIVPYAPEAGVYLVGITTPQRPGDRSGGVFGATVSLGMDDGDDSGIDRGSVLLAIGADEPLRLDPVLVRRDISPRWREAGVGRERIASRPVEDASEASDAGDEGIAATGDSAGAFDWHRAVFEPRLAVNGASDARASAITPPADGEIPTDLAVVAPADTVTAPQEVEVEPGPVGQESEAAGPAAGTGDDRWREKYELPADLGLASAPEAATAMGVTVEEQVVTDDQRAGHDDLSVPAAVPPPAGSQSDDAAPTPKAVVTAPADDTPSERDYGQAPPQAPEPRSPIVRQQPLFLSEARSGDATEGEASAEALIRVECFGDFEVFVAGTPLTGWRYEKGRELVALLVVHGSMPVPRTVVAEALWPDMLWDSSVRHMMSNAATTVRKAIRDAGGSADLQPLTLARDRYQFLPGIIESDLDEFEAALRRAVGLPASDALDQYARAVELYRGDVMQSELFEWLDRYRVEYRKRFLEAARTAAGLALELGDPERAAWFFAAGMQHAPADEPLARGLMRCRSALGDASGVRKVYLVLTEALQRELGAPNAAPSAETRALLEELTTGAVVG